MIRNLSKHLSDEVIKLWFEEDIGEGDHTTLSTIQENIKGKANLIVKQDGIIAGVSVAERVFKLFDPSLTLKIFMHDGAKVKKGDIIYEVYGSTRSILQTERLVLNIMQRMSGIATETNEYVKLIDGLHTKILDTRKTTPGFRPLEKEAIRLGGGSNHRFGLYDMILIKDNHIDYAGCIENAIRMARKYLEENSKPLEIEVEARTLEDVRKILQTGGVDRILLDNFTPEQTREAVKLINGEIETESSGNITKQNIRLYAECGVDYISAGSLTHQISSLDLSLKAVK